MDGSGEIQIEVCGRFGTKPFPTPIALKVGIASNVRAGVQPLNGLRCQPVGDTSGWYIWAGEDWSDDPEFFAPLHIRHLDEWCSAAIPYLLLPNTVRHTACSCARQRPLVSQNASKPGRSDVGFPLWHSLEATTAQHQPPRPGDCARAVRTSTRFF
jgi:hypothetical protein